MSMPSLHGQKFINRERPRSQSTPSFSLGSFASSWQGPQPMHRDLLPMLLSRGFEAATEQRTVDMRQWHDLNPLLQRAESRPRATDPLERLGTTAGSTTAGPRRGPGTMQRAGTMRRTGSNKQLGSRQSMVQSGSRQSLYSEAGAGGGAGGAPDAAMDERLRQKLGVRAKEMQQRARVMRERADAHGIFDPSVNRLRASSACLCEMRRSASLEEVRDMRSKARHELQLGLPFEDEAALKGAAGRGHATALQRKLDHLDVALEAAVAERRRVRESEEAELSTGRRRSLKATPGWRKASLGVSASSLLRPPRSSTACRGSVGEVSADDLRKCSVGTMSAAGAAGASLQRSGARRSSKELLPPARSLSH